jgi:hypothetical protein
MKDAADGKGPKPAAQFGKQYLYKPADAIAYAKSLIQPVK